MIKMPDWTKPEIKQRLLTAIVASVDKVGREPCIILRISSLTKQQLDVARIAQLYGEDVTKGAVEWQLRCIKKEAKLMKEGAGGSSAKNGDDDAALKSKPMLLKLQHGGLRELTSVERSRRAASRSLRPLGRRSQKRPLTEKMIRRPRMPPSRPSLEN